MTSPTAVETSLASVRPSAQLAPFLRTVHGVRVRGGPPERHLELPVAGTAVILALEHPWRIAPRETAPLVRHTSFAGGLTLAPAVSEHDGAFEVVEFVLTPLGTAAVFGVPAAALASAVVALDELLGRDAERLTERLAGTATWAARFAVLERWLVARVAQRPQPISPDVAWALARVDATGGRVPVGTLQHELGCSRRHLATRFAQAVGTTPKAYAQLVRFGRAAERLRAGEVPAAVAATCGYADQAHLTRHVRRFGATTPGRLRRDGLPPVTSVQDGAPAAA
jgi:AraC-like DNA-binding protein